MGKNGNFRLTRLERNWILYDVGNSAFVLMVATLASTSGYVLGKTPFMLFAAA